MDAAHAEPRAAGHRVVPETSDFILEAWGPTREECIVQAVAALVECFADVTAAAPTRIVPFAIPEGDEKRQLLGVLEESLSVFEIFGVVPVDTRLDRADDGSLAGCFETADVNRVRLISGTPTGVRLHALELDHIDGWHCLVGVDV